MIDVRRDTRERAGSRAPRPWLALGIWALALLFAVEDLRQVLGTSWMGSDFQPVVTSVFDLVHHRPFPGAYVYPPGLLVLGLPLLLAQHGRRGEDLALVVETIALLVAVWCMARLVGRRLLDGRVAAVALVLALSAQVTYALQLGNLTLVLIPAAALFYLAVDRNRPMVAALVLGLSLVTKPMLLPLIVPLLVARKWRATAVSIAIPLVLSVLTLPFVSRPINFIRSTISNVAGGGATSQTNNVNLVDLAHLLHLGNGPAAAMRVVAAAAAVVIARQLWVSDRPALERTVWSTQILLTGLLLVFSLTHSFYPLLLLPLTFLAADRARTASSVVALAGIALSWMPFHIPGVIQVSTSQPVQIVICSGMLMVLVAGGLAAREIRRAATGSGAPSVIIGGASLLAGPGPLGPVDPAEQSPL